MKLKFIRIMGILSLWMLAAPSAHPASEVYAQSAQVWNTANATKFHHWMKELSMPMGQMKTIALGQTFSKEKEALLFDQKTSMSGLTLTGAVSFGLF